MTFHESTVKKLRWALSGHQDHLEEAERNVEVRTQALADAQRELANAVERASTLRANVADCQRWLDFAALCDHDTELAHAFANAVLNRNAEMADAKEHWSGGHDAAGCTECAGPAADDFNGGAWAALRRTFGEANVEGEAGR